MNAVVTSGLSKRYGKRVAVRDLDLVLREGTITGFVGPNGAGKTTTLRMLLGLARPSAGAGTVLGEPLEHPERYLREVGALIETPAFYPKLSGQDNLCLLAALGRLDRRRAHDALARVGLAGRGKDKFRSYSLGMKQRLGLAAALLSDPKLLILDEPANGMDPDGIRELRELLRELACEGKTILVSSHLLAEIESVCDDVVLIRDGVLRFQGSVSEMLAGRAGAELTACPERPEDLAALAALASAAGYQPRVTDDGIALRAPRGYAAALNRAAHDAGIVLRELHSAKASLEDAYFAITTDQTPEAS